MSYATQTTLIAIDRSLTPEQVAAAESLSSRAVVTHRSARYTYHFGGDFRGDETQMLTTGGFDALLWEDSAGGSRLVFRLPAETMPWEAVSPFLPTFEYPSVEIEAPLVGSDRLLSFRLMEEEAEGRWLEEDNGGLEALLPLRAALLMGDYRCLYLAYLQNRSNAKAAGEEDVSPDALPVLPGLDGADPALDEFCDRFYIYEDVIASAVAASSPSVEVDYHGLVDKLTETQKDRFLHDYLEEKTVTTARLKRLLRDLSEGVS